MKNKSNINENSENICPNTEDDIELWVVAKFDFKG